VARLQTAGAGLNQEWREYEVVLAVDENDLRVLSAQAALQRLGAIGASKPSTENNDALFHFTDSLLATSTSNAAARNCLGRKPLLAMSGVIYPIVTFEKRRLQRSAHIREDLW
jgi:hypothetical protein